MENSIDSIELLPDGSVGYRIVTTEGDSTSYHRATVSLGSCVDGVWTLADNSGAPAEALATAQELWTPEVIAAARARAEAEYTAGREAKRTTDNVRKEAQRRIIALVGATDLTSCLIKQLNANMRANELNDIQHSRELTPQEAAEAEALRSLAVQIKAIRAASNTLEPNPPVDFTDNKYWP